MKDAEYQQLITTAEANVFRYDHEYTAAFIAILKEHEAELTPTQSDQLKAEVAAFMIGTVDTTRHRQEQRLRRDTDLTSEQLTYYYGRSQACTNIVMQQRYFDILWEKFKGKNRREIGEGLVKSSLELVQLPGHDNEFEKADSLNRAIQVAVLMDKDRGELIESCTTAIRDYLRKLEKGGKIRYTLELIDTVIQFSKLFTKADYDYCHSLCEQAIPYYKDKDNNFTLRGAFIERLYSLKKLIDPTSHDSKALARELAGNLIAESERRADSIMVQQHFLIEAEKVLKDAGLTADAKVARRRVEALGKSDAYNEQFHEFSLTQEIPKELITSLRDLLRKYPDTTALLALTPNFRPSWSDAVKSHEESDVKSVTDFLVTSTMIDDNGMTIAIDDSMPERKGAMRYFEASSEFKIFVAANLIRELVKDKTIKLKNFDAQFLKLKHISEPMYESVRHGLKLFLRGDYYPASLIFVTQLENLIFNLLPMMDIEQYIFENDGQTQSPKTLGWMLDDIREVIGEDLYELFSYTLVDKIHLNLRGMAAHGKTNIKSDNLRICVRLIQLFGCLLVNVNVSASDKQGRN